MSVNVANIKNRFLIKSLLNQLNKRTLAEMGAAFLAYLGIFWTILKFLDYMCRVYENCKPLHTIMDLVDKFLIFELAAVVLLAIITKWKKSIAVYSVSRGVGTIVFDNCDVLKAKGYRVIEMPTTFCTNFSSMPKDSDSKRFLSDYDKYVKTNNLRSLIKDQLKKNGKKPQNTSTRNIQQENYALGCIAEIDYKSEEYLLTSSISVSNDQKVLASFKDYDTFLANFWTSLHAMKFQEDIICIPVFSAWGQYGIPINENIYLIIKTYISSAKGLGKICKELRICIQDEDVKNFDLFISMSNIVDKYVTSSESKIPPKGEGIE